VNGRSHKLPWSLVVVGGAAVQATNADVRRMEAFKTKYVGCLRPNTLDTFVPGAGNLSRFW